MASVMVCDGCGRPITDDNPQIAKLHMTILNGKKTRDMRNKYTHHMDIGKCCITKTNQLGKWHRRSNRTRKPSAAAA